MKRNRLALSIAFALTATVAATPALGQSFSADA